MSNTNQKMKPKVIAKLIAWGNNPEEVTFMVESHFEKAISYGYTNITKIAEFIRTVA